MLIVLDTNVLVNGLLNGSGNPGKIVDLILEGSLQIAFDDRILGEYEDVLARPELHIPQAKASAIIGYLELTGVFVEAKALSPTSTADVDDLPFVEVHMAANSEALVTGNGKHFLQAARVFTPTQFLEQNFKSLLS